MHIYKVFPKQTVHEQRISSRCKNVHLSNTKEEMHEIGDQNFLNQFTE